MSNDWNNNAPIYRQLKDRIVAMLLDGLLKPGDALPSVRQIAADFQLNPITVSRAYQELADATLVEKRRGIGMYVTDGAREKLIVSGRVFGADGRTIEQQRFLATGKTAGHRRSARRSDRRRCPRSSSTDHLLARISHKSRCIGAENH